ncbi:unnamed protein product [Lactuca saligna]|uniref:BAT2 N-terminal domain-containing protein n=1 Tax=Lactuca saligna TaxID=75948 RepID=A0AA35W0A1_LACSI|nr:unnamed protein product [Lactuca saligna]
MANNHGGSGSKFVSVNLNKLYGQPSHHNYPPHSGSYGPGVGTNRARPGGHASTGGGMVVLSRNRPLQKAVPKLSVPPPLNLPSLRKEYEKIDSSGAGGGAAGGAGSGSGSRPTSSGMGWTKPGNVALQEKEVGGDTLVSESVNYTEGAAATKGSGTYMPPSARFGGGLGHGDTSSAHHPNMPPLEKAMVLRGEDFPSLRAALPSSSGPAQKQKEGSFQKLKQLVSEESSNDLRNNSRFSSPAHIQSSHRIANGMNENGGQSPRSNSARPDHAQKQEDPLPLIRLNPRSDWADDERDTGYGFAGRSGRDQEFPKSEAYWDKDFDVPRSSILPHKPPNNLSERRGQHMGNIAKGPTSEVLKPDPYRRETNMHSRDDRESNSWRSSSIHEDRSTVPQVISNRNNVTVSDSYNNSKYMSALGDNAHHGVVSGNYVRRDTGQGRQGGQRHWNNSVESPRYQNAAGSNYGREKSSFSKSERNYLDDPYQKDFSSSVYDERDPFTGNLVGVVKRKKEVIKQTDFHDPVRESFEAELERVQKMQEMERQRVVEEQERALEQARREDEEKRRVIIEEEERRRRMEEEAREAAWRAEQERLEAIQKAEEQRVVREEEKRRMLLEEERRKQAAKQKLLELEAKIAKREAEVGKSGGDDEVPAGGKDSDASMDSDLDNWEVSQRMVERITTSASSDSSAIDRPFDRPQFSREVSSSFVERGKPVNAWKRDAFEVGSNSSFLLNDQENGHHSPRREAPIGGRSFPRKDFYSGGGYMSSRSPFRGGIQDPDTDGFPHDHRWNSFGDGDSYGRTRDIESEFYDNVGEVWGHGQGHSRGNRLYMNNSESDKLYPYGRSRYSMKQPRVLPPPSLSSIPKSSVRGENELSAPSSSLESTARTGGNYGGVQDKLEQSDLVDVQQEIMAQKLDKNDTLRCDSQSSLSVSSPPSSPTHLSHDELDDSSVIPTGGDGNETPEHDVNDESGEVREVTTMAAGDDDEEWSLENQDEMQVQEEYDEDDDGYGEEDEVHEGNDENINLTQEFQHMGLEEKSTNNVMENLVLGFNEGVEVRIPGDETDVNTTETPEEKQDAVDSVNSVINESVVQPQNATSDSSTTTHALPSVPIQTDLPVKLQFGLFSGPSLIPSPVPAIQIGSIQMPLHLHPPVGSSMGHLHHQSQPPLFQFGQLRYTSPISQGILPITSQSNIHQTHFNLNQTSNSGTLPNQFSQETMKKDNHENWSRGLTGIASKPVTQTEEKVHGTPDNNKPSQKDVPLSKAPGPNKGKRPTYPPRNSGSRSFHGYDSSPANEYRKNRRPIQRTEFRVRENSDRKQTPGIGSSNFDDKFKHMGASRSGYRRHMVPVKSLKRVVPDGSGSHEMKETATARLTPPKTQSTEGGNLKRNMNILEEEVDGSDAPLQSGVVRVFKQPGIECPSDEDDFIEVRSKRQMLNDRREQREKEIKAKSRVAKQPRKASPSVQAPNKISVSLVGESSNKEPSADFSTVSSQSQPLAPIGTPAVDTNKTPQRGSGIVEDSSSNRMFEAENKAVDDVQTSLGDWGNARTDPQVIPLTQTQLDEAMKPARFNTTHVTSIGDHTNTNTNTNTSEPILPSSSILTKGKSISSSSSPINSLLAGEKIQFGAVTSPTILPPSSRVVSHVIGAPGSFRPDMTQNISKTENIFFKKEDSEAEVEAVAVAAIDRDEIVGNGVGPETGPVSVSSDQQSGSQSKPEESLSVSLPADLSVETPPISSLWPPLPSPQSSSTAQMLSHFHGPTPSHFPFYEMNHHHPPPHHPHPMMTSPVFAFGPHDESGGTQPQSQKTTNSGSNPRHMLPPWQNHSGMDSFYGPPAGFTGPFIGSPGVQAPPHMVVYNHYAPVGQFGQVGLSFMGATYIPSGKQPDWKHDPTTSSVSVSRGEEDMMVSGQRHLAPGSPLLSMGSPLTMFDVPPFQAAPDMPRWSHVPHAVPMSLPLQQQPPEAMTGPSQFSSHVGHPVDQSMFPPNRFSEPQTSTPSFPDELGLVVDSSGPSISTTSAAPVTGTTTKTVDVGGGGGGGETTNAFKNQHHHHQQGNKNLSSSQQYNNNNHHHHHHGYGYQRGGGGGGVSPKNKSMGGPGPGPGPQWSPHRRTGTFHGRYQSMGPEKSFPPSTKVKQIYVAKQPVPAASGGSSSTVG